MRRWLRGNWLPNIGTMELYFKDLISKESSLEKLVDDLSRVVQGADDFASAVSPDLTEQTRVEVTDRLRQLREHCRHLREQALIGARATDKLLREHPYASAAIAFSLGVLLGLRLRRRDS